jgi:hypothetical protein
MSGASESREPRVRALSGWERSLIEALRHFIDENHHPVTGVARRLGLRYVTLRKVLDGEQVPQARTVQLIANYLRTEAVSMAWERRALDGRTANGQTNEADERCPFCGMVLARQSGNLSPDD